MQDYTWLESRPQLVTTQDYDITIALDRRYQKLPYLNTTKSRTLVEVIINPSNDNTEVMIAFQNKLAQYVTIILALSLLLSKIIDGYYKF